MKIALFTDHYYPLAGGITTSVQTLKDSLEAKGHEVYIVTVKVPGYIEKSDHIIRIPAFKLLDMRVGYCTPTEVYKELVDAKFDVIHTHTEFYVGKLGIKLAKKEQIPMLHTCHTIYDVCIKNQFPFGGLHVPVTFMLNELLKSQLKDCQHLVVPSYKSKEALNKYIHMPVSVVPTGISIEKFGKKCTSSSLLKIRRSMDIQDHEKVILSVSRLSHEKRIDVIIRQFSKVAKEHNAKLLILGDGPERKALETLVRSLNLEDQVIFTGHIPSHRVQAFYQMSDFFISASKVETQGLTILEAMASRVPVIVVDDTNVKGIVSHQKSGWIFSSDDDLSQLLDQVLQDDYQEEVRRVSNEAFRVAISLSDAEYATNIEEIYKEASIRLGSRARLKLSGKVILNNQKRMRIN